MALTHFIKLDADGVKTPRPRRLNEADLGGGGEFPYLKSSLDLINRPFPERTASYAAAWLGSEAFLISPGDVLELLESNEMDTRTHNLLISKITESRVPSPSLKGIVRALKRR